MKYFVTCLIGLITLTLTTAAFSAVPPCTDTSRECVIKVAKTYLDSLLGFDASQVSLADNAERWENGVNTGKGAADIRDHLEHKDYHAAIAGIRDLRMLVDNDQVVAYYLLDVVIPYTKIHYGTTRVVEKFTVAQGKITDIEAVFCTSVNSTPEASRVPAPTSLSILCNRK